MKLYIHRSTLHSSEDVFKGYEHIFIYLQKQKKTKDSLKFTHHMAPMWFHMHNKMQKLFTWFSHK